MRIKKIGLSPTQNSGRVVLISGWWFPIKCLYVLMLHLYKWLPSSLIIFLLQYLDAPPPPVTGPLLILKESHAVHHHCHEAIRTNPSSRINEAVVRLHQLYYVCWDSLWLCTVEILQSLKHKLAYTATCCSGCQKQHVYI